MEPRTCIFTGLKSRHKLEITEDKHSWTRAVPCSKVYLICRENRKYRNHLLDLEKTMIKEFYNAELRAAMGNTYSDYEHLSWIQADQRTIKAILQEEIARYESMDDKLFERTLERLMEERLKGMF